MQRPELYGWFHLLSLLLVAAATVLLARRCRTRTPEQIRKLILLISIITVILEIYKQINFSFSWQDGISFHFQWYAFPFQFCSTPMYIGLLAGLTRKGRLHDAANAYLATYSVFAGLCVMLYPASVFIDVIGINIQTMFCHGVMIVMGACLLSSGCVKLTSRSIAQAIPVFTVCVLLAWGMNEIAYRTGLLENHTFNMFFISPYCEPSLPVYSLVQAVAPFPASLLIYIGGFTLAAYLVLLAAIGIGKLLRRTHTRKHTHFAAKPTC